MAELLAGDQQAALVGQRNGQRWAGEVTVLTELGDFSWAWSGQWSGPDTHITGQLSGVSSVELGEQTYSVTGDGTFEAWPLP